MPESIVFNMDCMEGMKQYPDKYFDLAVVDPPYGIGAGSKKFVNRSSANKKNEKFYKDNDWDIAPKDNFFIELFRVSKNQIIWGGNYFIDFLHNTRCMIFWDKGTGANSYADGEIAWTSFDSNIRIFKKSWIGANAIDLDGRHHPTQKPVALYKWLLQNYAKAGDKILDTHIGSGSSRIAAYDLGFDFTGYELDTDYYLAQEKRFKNHIAQQSLFVPEKKVIIEQKPLF